MTLYDIKLCKHSVPFSISSRAKIAPACASTSNKLSSTSGLEVDLGEKYSGVMKEY